MESIHLLAHAGLNLNLVWEIMKLICSLIHPSSQLDLIWMKNTGLWSRTRVKLGKPREWQRTFPHTVGRLELRLPNHHALGSSRPQDLIQAPCHVEARSISKLLFISSVSMPPPACRWAQEEISNPRLVPPERCSPSVETLCERGWSLPIFSICFGFRRNRLNPQIPHRAFYCGTSREMQEKKLHSVLRLVLLC